VRTPRPLTPIWVRAVVDPRFRDALIADPLRAVAQAGDVHASGEQVRQLEEMEPDERAELVMGVVREVHWRGGQARFGALRDDGRIGGPE
jgi:hypothetical protein